MSDIIINETVIKPEIVNTIIQPIVNETPIEVMVNETTINISMNETTIEVGDINQVLAVGGAFMLDDSTEVTISEIKPEITQTKQLWIKLNEG
jgi:hypothetical protein